MQCIHKSLGLLLEQMTFLWDLWYLIVMLLIDVLSFIFFICVGQVRVAYCSEHRGHEFDVFHIGLRKKQREQLANKLASGMSFDEVLNSCCQNGSTAESFPVTKKDLENICREFGVDRKKYICADVEDNVAEWIEVTTQDLETLQSDCNTEQYLAACDSAYSFVRTAMQESLHLAEMAAEHLENLRTLFVAEMSKSQ